ncbi:MAG: DUF3419 family protein [Deltaproteobacteria bacterium]|nr:DUF3419 family protein [Deltaproteobacteria bacterium]
MNPLRRIAPEPRRTTTLGLRFVADPAGLGSFAERVLRERNLYGALAFAETAESMRLSQAALQVGSGDRVVGIGSSGDMLLSLVSEGADEVVGFDTNPTQVALASLKLAAIQHLTVEEYLKLFGVVAASGRWRLELFDRLSRATTSEVRRTLMRRRGWVPKGVLNHGMTHLIIRAMVTAVARLVDKETLELFLGEHGSDAERARSLDALLARRSTRAVVEPFAQRFAAQLKWLFFPHKLCRVSERPDEMIADFFTTFRPLFIRGAKGNPVLARSAQGDLHPEWTAHLYDEARFEAIAAAAPRCASRRRTSPLVSQACLRGGRRSSTSRTRPTT